MKNLLRTILFLTCSLFVLSCSDDDGDSNEIKSDKTVVLFFPYTQNLYHYLNKNIQDVEKAMLKNRVNPNVIVYINQDRLSSCIYKITRKGNTCVHDTLRTYRDNSYTDKNGLKEIFSDIISLSPGTNTYSMVVGCHGMGWIYGDDYENIRRNSPRLLTNNYDVKNPITRWMGVNSAKIDVDAFADAMEEAGLHTQTLLFDVCYMGNVETIFRLRNVSEYVLGSAVEIMSAGMPYEIIWDDIVNGSENALNEVCRKYYEFYNGTSNPYATLAAVNCKKLDALAQVVKEINGRFEFDENDRKELQVLDGFNPSLYFDLGRYVDLQCKDTALKERFHQALDEAVPFRYNTARYYTDLTEGFHGTHDIKYFSGLSVSAPSLHPIKDAGWSRTDWYKATH